MTYSYLPRTNTIATQLLISWAVNIEKKCLVNGVIVNANMPEIFILDDNKRPNRAEKHSSA